MLPHLFDTIPDRHVWASHLSNPRGGWVSYLEKFLHTFLYLPFGVDLGLEQNLRIDVNPDFVCSRMGCGN